MQGMEPADPQAAEGERQHADTCAVICHACCCPTQPTHCNVSATGHKLAQTRLNAHRGPTLPPSRKYLRPWPDQVHQLATN